MNENNASVYVTKLAAAQRQLCAAIRMFFSGEDDLATHTVGSAAYRLLADLKRDRGRDEAGDYWFTAIFYVVRDYHRGNLPSYLTRNEKLMSWVVELADHLPITASSQFKQFAVNLSAEEKATYWRWRNKAANFLKHADQDPKAALQIDNLDNLGLLISALGAYVDLIDVLPSPEGLILWVYFSVHNNVDEGIAPEYERLASLLQKVPTSGRLVFCDQWLREFRSKAPDKAS